MFNGCLSLTLPSPFLDARAIAHRRFKFFGGTSSLSTVISPCNFADTCDARETIHLVWRISKHFPLFQHFG